MYALQKPCNHEGHKESRRKSFISMFLCGLCALCGFTYLQDIHSCIRVSVRGRFCRGLVSDCSFYRMPGIFRCEEGAQYTGRKNPLPDWGLLRYLEERQMSRNDIFVKCRCEKGALPDVATPNFAGRLLRADMGVATSHRTLLTTTYL